MYKLKDLYQDNPHTGKRKGGKKTNSDKMIIKNRRISAPTPGSPKVSFLSFDIFNKSFFNLIKSE